MMWIEILHYSIAILLNVNTSKPGAARSCRGSGENIAFCAPRRMVICVASLQELLGLITKEECNFQRSVGHPRSVRYDFLDQFRAVTGEGQETTNLDKAYKHVTIDGKR